MQTESNLDKTKHVLQFQTVQTENPPDKTKHIAEYQRYTCKYNRPKNNQIEPNTYLRLFLSHDHKLPEPAFVSTLI